LSQPNFLMNEFREVVGIWAGDLRGNMWKFDVSSADPTLWRVAYNGDPLFTTTANQPITVMPQLSRFQTTSQVMVTFGTGKLFDLEDTSTSAATNVNLTQQAIYGLWDDGATPIAGIARLVEQTAGARGTGSFSTTSRNTVNFSPTVRGWYMRLDDGTGERVHVNPIIPFNSPNTPVYIVANTPSTAPCSSGGSTRLFALDPQTGQAPSFTVFTGGTGGNVYSSTSGVGSTPSFAGGATPPDMTRNTNVLGGNGQIGGTTFEEGDCISGSEAQSPNSSTGIESLEIGGPVCRGRISWRQLK
jgi:type IV pilus assembly protein PilY1